MSSSYCRRMVSLCLSDACSSRASRLPRRVTSLFSRVTSLRRSPRSARRDSIVAFWFSARSRVARSRRLSLSAGEASLRLAGSILASESNFSRRVTSAGRESASFAVRRTSCVSATAAFSLLRLLSSCHFREPARARDSTSAQRNASQRASAASARARSRSARACSRSYSERQSRGAHAGAASGDDQIPSPLSTSVRSVPKSSSRTAIRSTIARGVSVRSGRGMGPVKRISHVEARPHKVLSFCW